MRPPECKDCIAAGVTRWRAIAPDCGPRTPLCVTHRRERKRARSARAHELRLEKTYSITADEYWRILAAQGGKCAICQKAIGRARRLAVDHEHSTGLVRGILCGPCNRMIGHLGIQGFLNALEYLKHPPAIEVIGCRTVPLTDVLDRKSMS